MAKQIEKTDDSTFKVTEDVVLERTYEINSLAGKKEDLNLLIKNIQRNNDQQISSLTLKIGEIDELILQAKTIGIEPKLVTDAVTPIISENEK